MSELDQRTSAILRRRGYIITDRLAAGAFGQVYKAEKNNDVYAVKVVDLEKVEQRVKDVFLPRELLALTEIRHENAIRIHDIFRANRKIYIFMDFAPNGDIARYMKTNRRPVSEELARIWFRQVTSALRYLHEQVKMCHRDIKLDNILLDKNNIAKLTDFGFAKLCVDANGNVIPSTTFCGTAPYHSPQIVARHRYNPIKADMWAMGVVLFAMLNNKFLFHHHDHKAMYDEMNKYPQFIHSRYIREFPQPIRDLQERLCHPIEDQRPTAAQVLMYPWIREDRGRVNSQLQCRDENGKVVDWYVVYKFPKISGGKSPLDTGLKYAFITNNSQSGWTLSSIPISDSQKSIFGRTLSPIYETTLDPNLSYAMYNDEPPEKDADSVHAHAKGVIAADDKFAFWLIHSVPHFSSTEESNKYEYPSTGARYGQIALCISMMITEFNKVVDQLIYMQPLLYSSHVSSEVKSRSKDISSLVSGNWTLNAGHNWNEVTIESSLGQKFVSFSKNGRANVELYDTIVGPTLKTALYVETWRKNPGTPLPSTCNITYRVENVNNLTLKFDNSQESATFGYQDDHSKWAIAQSGAAPYVCIGDINRMQSQYKRGGGTTCFDSKNVWNNFNQWVKETEKC